MNDFESLVINADGQTVAVFYRHISKIVHQGDVLTIVTDDGGAVTVSGKSNIAAVFKMLEPIMPSTVAHLRQWIAV